MYRTLVTSTPGISRGPTCIRSWRGASRVLAWVDVVWWNSVLRIIVAFELVEIGRGLPTS